MTDILFKMLKKKFPEEQGHKVGLYENYERIYLTLANRLFVGASEFNNMEVVKGLARRIFANTDFYWGHTFYSGSKKISTIIFLPEFRAFKLNIYQKNYSGHSIEIKIPAISPEMTISTGNRGTSFLFPSQRNKYYGFTVGVYKLFIENAKQQRKTGEI